jgi:hypothetical protein
MSGVPRSNYDPRRLFLFNFPKLNLGGKGREIGTYIAGGLVRSHTNRQYDQEELKPIDQFAASFFLLIDAATVSAHAKPPPDAPYDTVPIHMSFVDWIPAIFSTRRSHSSLSLSSQADSVCYVIDL